MGSIVQSELITAVITHVLFTVRAEIGTIFYIKSVLNHVVYLQFSNSLIIHDVISQPERPIRVR